MKLLVAIGLLLLFLKAVVISGLQTVRVILRQTLGGTPPPAGLVRMRFAPMSEDGATLLGCMISLTPGTTTIDIDMERGEMLLHLLDTSQAEEAIAGIRADFEPSLIKLFGKGAP
ncbi:MAG: Na+/H+ antiporter subunit E [Phycisphaeraceae bacterium]|nr:Na+/H+ antiporter subunit E [Phycisphaeraceae bacterium]